MHEPIVEAVSETTEATAAVVVPCQECHRHPSLCLYALWTATPDMGAGAGVRFACAFFDAEVNGMPGAPWEWRVRGRPTDDESMTLAAGVAATRLAAMYALADALHGLGLFETRSTGELVTAMILSRARGPLAPRA